MTGSQPPLDSRDRPASRRVYDLPELRRLIFDLFPTTEVLDLMLLDKVALSTAMDNFCERKELDCKEYGPALYYDKVRASVRKIKDQLLWQSPDCPLPSDDESIIHTCGLRQDYESQPMLVRSTGVLNLPGQKQRNVFSSILRSSVSRYNGRGYGGKRLLWCMTKSFDTLNLLETVQVGSDCDKLPSTNRLDDLETCDSTKIRHDLSVELSLSAHTDLTTRKSTIETISREKKVTHLAITSADDMDLVELGIYALATRKTEGTPFNMLFIDLGDYPLPDLTDLFAQVIGGTKLLQILGNLVTGPWVRSGIPPGFALHLRAHDDGFEPSAAIETGGTIILGQLDSPYYTIARIPSLDLSMLHHLRVLDLAANGDIWNDRHRYTIPFHDLAGIVSLCRSSLPALRILRLDMSDYDYEITDNDVPVSSWLSNGCLESLFLGVWPPENGPRYRYGFPHWSLAINMAALCNSRTDVSLRDWSDDFIASSDDVDPDFMIYKSREFHDLVHWMVNLHPDRRASIRESTSQQLGIHPIHTHLGTWRELKFDQHDQPIPVPLTRVVKQLKQASKEDTDGLQAGGSVKKTLEQFNYLMGLE